MTVAVPARTIVAARRVPVDDLGGIADAGFARGDVQIGANQNRTVAIQLAGLRVIQHHVPYGEPPVSSATSNKLLCITQPASGRPM